MSSKTVKKPRANSSASNYKEMDYQWHLELFSEQDHQQIVQLHHSIQNQTLKFSSWDQCIQFVEEYMRVVRVPLKKKSDKRKQGVKMLSYCCSANNKPKQRNVTRLSSPFVFGCKFFLNFKEVAPNVIIISQYNVNHTHEPLCREKMDHKMALYQLSKIEKEIIACISNYQSKGKMSAKDTFLLLQNEFPNQDWDCIGIKKIQNLIDKLQREKPKSFLAFKKKKPLRRERSVTITVEKTFINKACSSPKTPNEVSTATNSPQSDHNSQKKTCCEYSLESPQINGSTPMAVDMIQVESIKLNDPSSLLSPPQLFKKKKFIKEFYENSSASSPSTAACTVTHYSSSFHEAITASKFLPASSTFESPFPKRAKAMTASGIDMFTSFSAAAGAPKFDNFHRWGSSTPAPNGKRFNGFGDIYIDPVLDDLDDNLSKYSDTPFVKSFISSQSQSNNPKSFECQEVILDNQKKETMFLESNDNSEDDLNLLFGKQLYIPIPEDQRE